MQGQGWGSTAEEKRQGSMDNEKRKEIPGCFISLLLVVFTHNLKSK